MCVLCQRSTHPGTALRCVCASTWTGTAWGRGHTSLCSSSSWGESMTPCSPGPSDTRWGRTSSVIHDKNPLNKHHFKVRPLESLILQSAKAKKGQIPVMHAKCPYRNFIWDTGQSCLQYRTRCYKSLQIYSVFPLFLNKEHTWTYLQVRRLTASASWFIFSYMLYFRPCLNHVIFSYMVYFHSYL